MGSIVVTGQIARYPLGGVTWDWLNYLLGLKALGFKVHYFEDGSDWFYNPVKNTVMQTDYNLKYLKKVMSHFKFDWTYLSREREYNLSKEVNNKLFGNKDFKNIINSADAVINIAGSSNMQKLNEDFKIDNAKKIFVDGDPMLNQLKIVNKDRNLMESINAHDKFFTYAENIGNKDCEIPLSKSIDWKPTRFPVFLDSWNHKSNKIENKFTTVANWQSYKGFRYKGKTYSGCKSIEFVKLAKVPKLSKQKLELAIIADTKEKKNSLLKKTLKDKSWISNVNNLNKMKAGGWKIADARKISKDWNAYKNYINSSKGEFSVAKNMYVKAKTGWFSCRSTCYLAAGKPVVLQETGFSKFIPTGKGLFSFSNLQEAADAVKEINKDYEYHSKEARKIAEKYFDSDKVLGKMLKQCGI